MPHSRSSASQRRDQRKNHRRIRSTQASGSCSSRCRHTADEETTDGTPWRRRLLLCAAQPQTLQWVSAVSVAVLMFAKGTAIQKSFLVPLFALQAPASVISWIKGDYGTWTAFLALLVRLFYFVPGGLELPFLAMLLVIVAPYQTMNLRGTQAGAIVSLAIAGYLAFQHFSRVGGLRKACDQGSIVATSAVVCSVIIPWFFLF